MLVVTIQWQTKVGANRSLAQDDRALGAIYWDPLLIPYDEENQV